MNQNEKQFHLRLDESTLNKLYMDSNKAGISASAYVRALINGNVLKEAPDVELFKTLTNDLHRTSINVNQLAAHANTSGAVNPESLQQMSERLEDLRKEILDLFYK